MKLIERYYVKVDEYRKDGEHEYEDGYSLDRNTVIRTVSTRYKIEKKPVGCIALYESEETGKKIFGYSICSELDNFSKKVAREVAEQRACDRLNLPESEWFNLTDEEICKFPREARKDAIEVLYTLKGII